MMDQEKPLVFPFHYGQEAEQYSFYKVPKILFTSPMFEKLSTEAKLLYGLLLDRMQLSIQTGWIDDEGRVYIYFTIESIMRALNCGNKKASALLAELDEKRGIGLITRVRQGLGKPDKILVHKCALAEMSGIHFKRCQNDTSKEGKQTAPKMSKPPPNKTDSNKTEINETEFYPIHSENVLETGYDAKAYEQYRKYFWEQLAMDALLVDYPYDQEALNEILDILVETVCSNRQTIRIAGDDKPVKVVKERLMKLNVEHIRYVMSCMKETTVKVRNIRQYLLAALYNAPATISHYYSALVQHNMYGQSE